MDNVEDDSSLNITYEGVIKFFFIISNEWLILKNDASANNLSAKSNPIHK